MVKKKHVTVDAVVKRVAKNLVDGERGEWPPRCSTLLYQLVRPVKTTEQKKG